MADEPTSFGTGDVLPLCALQSAEAADPSKASANLDGPDGPGDSSEPGRPEVQYYRDIDLASALAPEAFGPLEKVGSAYVSRLTRPLLVQTPALRLAEAPGGAQLLLALPAGLRRFACRVEDRVLQACLANKGPWFKRPIEDDSLRASFKRFACERRGTLKVRVTPQTVLFDEHGAHLGAEDPEDEDEDDEAEAEAAAVGGTAAQLAQLAPGDGVRCLLELSKVCFGRTEFGATWTLVQAQRAEVPPPPPPKQRPRCLIDPSAETCRRAAGGLAPAAAAHEDADIGEFL